MQNAVIAYPGNSPFPGVCYLEDRDASRFVCKSKNCAGNSYLLGIPLDKGVPFAFLHTAHVLANFSPVHKACRFVVYKLCAPWCQWTDSTGHSREANTFCEILLFFFSDSKAFDLTCCVFFTSFRTLAVI